MGKEEALGKFRCAIAPRIFPNARIFPIKSGDTELVSELRPEGLKEIVAGARSRNGRVALTAYPKPVSRRRNASNAGFRVVNQPVVAEHGTAG